MIYWFTGQSGTGKTVLGTKLRDFLQTEKTKLEKGCFSYRLTTPFSIRRSSNYFRLFIGKQL